MANLPEAPTWEAGIYQFERTDPVEGGPDGIDNTPTKQLANRTAYLKQEVELRAPLASPALTGNPTAPTQAPGNTSTRLANTAFVQAALAALVDSSPAALDTLNELAAALGDDPNFATTVMNALAEKAPLNSPVLTGVPSAPTAPDGDNSFTLATTEFVQTALIGRGYVFKDRLLFTAASMFSKAAFPGLLAIGVHLYGGGGSSGGAQGTSGTQNASAAGGGGGEYAYKFILAENLLDDEPVTVGLGGAAQGDGSSGVNGGDTLFGAHATARGGNGGQYGQAASSNTHSERGLGGTGGVGDFTIDGEDGGNGRVIAGTVLSHNDGGGTKGPFGASRITNPASQADGRPGKFPGGGATGAINGQSQSARPGAKGGDGAVYIDLFY